MYLSTQPLRVPKAGSSPHECDDACCPEHELEQLPSGRFAVADGATETSFSGIWATQLVRAYCRGQLDTPESFQVSLASLQERWWKIVRRKPLPWYAEEKLKQGTFSSLLGVNFDNADYSARTGHWNAIASGDSCLVQVRADTVIVTFPFSGSSEFNSHPTLLSTSSDCDQALSRLTTTSGTWTSEDCFFLMTDALAVWFYRELELRREPWKVLRDLEVDRKKPFQKWVDAMRQQGSMKNDDVTLYRINID